MQDNNGHRSLPGPNLSLSFTFFIMMVLVLVASWTRIAGLAERQIAWDEYFFIKSVRNILEFGIPRYPSGGYYFRGILPQYIAAFCQVLFGEGLFAYRFPSALFGIGTVVMGYFLGRQFLSRSWSIVLAGMLALSSWEVEFSRFARMYSGFQFTVVCFFWSLYRYSFDENSKRRYLAVVFALIGILSHELGLFLAVFLFLPFVECINLNWRRKCISRRFYIGLSSSVLLIGLFLAIYDFRLIGVSDPLPKDYVNPIAKSSAALSFGINLFGGIGFVGGGALISACIVGWYALYAIRNRLKINGEEQLVGGLLIFAIWSAIFHQFAICLIFILAIIIRNPKIVIKKPYLYLLSVLAGIAFIWLVLLWFWPGWSEFDRFGSVLGSYRKAIRENFFKFPDIYLPVIRAWADNIPILGFFLLSAVVYQIIRIRQLSLAMILRNPVVPILAIVIFMGVRPPAWMETRYTHFMYPMALCVGLLSASGMGEMLKRFIIKREIGGQGLSIAVCLLIFAGSEDFNAFHLSKLNSDEVAFRIGKYERFSRHWYWRFDFKGPAELVNGDGSGKSRIIVVRDVETIGFYLDKEYVLYFPWNVEDYSIVSREGGTRDLWSGKPMISSIKEIIDLTQEGGTVWIMHYPVSETLMVDPERFWPGRVEKVEVFKPGRDKRIQVWKIELR